MYHLGFCWWLRKKKWREYPTTETLSGTGRPSKMSEKTKRRVRVGVRELLLLLVSTVIHFPVFLHFYLFNLFYDMFSLALQRLEFLKWIYKSSVTVHLVFFTPHLNRKQTSTYCLFKDASVVVTLMDSSVKGQIKTHGCKWCNSKHHRTSTVLHGKTAAHKVRSTSVWWWWRVRSTRGTCLRFSCASSVVFRLPLVSLEDMGIRWASLWWRNLEKHIKSS